MTGSLCVVLPTTKLPFLKWIMAVRFGLCESEDFANRNFVTELDPSVYSGTMVFPYLADSKTLEPLGIA